MSHGSVLVTEGDNVTVSCNGSGLPLPDVDWTISGLRSINTHMVKYTHTHTGWKQLLVLRLISLTAFMTLRETAISV